jgi:fructose/tagatose bisphosphate aldolase
MSLVNMKEMLTAARKAHKAIGAFNITNYETAAAVLKAAEAGATVLLGASVFHFNLIAIPALKQFLKDRGFNVRI